MLKNPNWKPAETQTEEWRKILLKAADIIDQYGWTSGYLGSCTGGFCAVGAIQKALWNGTYSSSTYCTVRRFAGRKPEKGDLYKEVLGHLADSLPKGIGNRPIDHWADRIYDWNDSKAETKSVVVDKLREVAYAI